jgi:hypothetical protein
VWPWGFESISISGPGQKDSDLTLANDEMATVIDFGFLGMIEPKITRQTVPLPAEARGRSFALAAHEGGAMTIAIADPPAFESHTERQRIYQFAADGTADAPREIDVPRAAGEQRSWWWTGLLPLASPLAQSFEIAASGKHSWRDYAGMSGPGDYALVLWWRDRWPLAVIALVALALAAACYRRQTRYQASPIERIVWPLFVFLLGVPGWIGYRYCRRWPELEPCPACHQPAPRAGEVCAACRHEFPLPAPQGAEIFA